MSEFPDYLAYGGWGVLLFVAFKFILPFLSSLSSRAATEGIVYDKAKDSVAYAYKQLEHERRAHDETRTQRDKLQQRVYELEAQLRELER